MAEGLVSVEGLTERPLPPALGAKVTSYPDGLRVVLFRSGQRGAAVTAAGSVRDADSSSGTSERSISSSDAAERLSSSIARSRRLVVHRARSLNPCAMWTFTRRGKFESSADAWAVWARFARLMRLRFGAGWRYVAVPELHGDGETWHLHVLVDRFYMVETLRVLWQRALGGTGQERGDQTLGNVHVKASRTRRASARRFAAYVSKYVGKGFERSGANRRVFAASVGLRPIAATRWHCPYDIGLGEFIDSFERWLRESFGVARFWPRILVRESWECAIADCPLPAAA